MIKKILDICFGKWWKPLTFFFFAVIIMIIGNYIHFDFFDYFSFIVFFVSILGLLFSTIYQAIKRRIGESIITGFVFLITIVICFFFFSIALFLYEQELPDKFADDLKIPTNIKIDKPIDLDFDRNRPDSLINKICLKPNFQLYNSFQPGLYEYDFWYGKIKKGRLFLKAYEITNNYPLSVERLIERSTIEIYNETDSIKRFTTNDHFTIYEGDWDKPYSARFEIWYKSENDKTEMKLLVKNYIIEGWQR